MCGKTAKMDIIIGKLETAKALAESEISFHKATIALVEFLRNSVESERMTPEEASKQFNEEYERREAQRIIIDFP